MSFGTFCDIMVAWKNIALDVAKLCRSKIFMVANDQPNDPALISGPSARTAGNYMPETAQCEKTSIHLLRRIANAKTENGQKEAVGGQKLDDRNILPHIPVSNSGIGSKDSDYLQMNTKPYSSYRTDSVRYAMNRPNQGARSTLTTIIPGMKSVAYFAGAVIHFFGGWKPQRVKLHALKLIWAILLLFAFSQVSQAQLVPYSDITLSSRGTPVGGAPIAVCGNPGLATTAAQVTANIAVLTMASNPITAGFVANQAIAVSAFTGADTYFNGGTVTSTGITNNFLILSVTSTQITYALTHANASATTNGSVFQAGSQAQACAPLATIFSDAAGLSPIAQPGFTSTGLGNYQFYAVGGTAYYVQFYGATIGEIIKPVFLSCAGTAACTLSGPQIFTNTIACTSINKVPCVDSANSAGWIGTDACAWISSSQSAALGLNGASGVIDARGLNGTITCAGTISIGSTTQGVSLLLGPNVRLIVQNSITLAQASTIRGAANTTGSVGVQDTVFQAGVSFPSNTYLMVIGPASGLADGVASQDFQLDCAGITGCKGMNIQNVQENSYFKGVQVIHNIGNGVDITGNSEDFSIENFQVIAGSAATTDNCFTQGTFANHIKYDTVTCTSQAASPSTGAGLLCTGCAANISTFHVENHTDGILLAASGTFSSVVINILNNAVAATNLLHIASGWFGSVRATGLRLNVGTNTVKNDVSGFAHVCTDAALNKYDLGWTRTPNAIALDTDCSTLASIRNQTLAISGTTAGNFTPDPTVLLDIRGPAATFSAIRMDDNTSGNSFKMGMATGTGWSLADRVNNKNDITVASSLTGATIVLPSACTTTTAQVIGSPPVVCAVTSQKTESAADANVLTFTPPATAGTYHVRFTMSVSAANAATLGATLTYTNSNGTAQAPTNLSIFQDGTAVPALTFTTSSAGDYFGDFNIDVNNSATAIVVKLTFSGTSFTAKVSAVVERII